MPGSFPMKVGADDEACAKDNSTKQDGEGKSRMKIAAHDGFQWGWSLGEKTTREVVGSATDGETRLNRCRGSPIRPPSRGRRQMLCETRFARPGPSKIGDDYEFFHRCGRIRNKVNLSQSAHKSEIDRSRPSPFCGESRTECVTPPMRRTTQSESESQISSHGSRSKFGKIGQAASFRETSP